jgi:hypothetical protein
VAIPYSDDTRALRTVMHTRTDLVDMRVAAANRLSALLDAYWPGAKAVFADVESPITLEFLTRYPTPNAARHLGDQRMAAFLVKHGYSSRRPAAVLLERLRSAPAGASGETLTEALRDAIRILARAWIRVICRCWHDQTPSNRTKQRAAAALNEPAAA